MVLLDHCSLNNYSVSVGITTNLTMLTDKMIEIFDAYQVGLLVSIDGIKFVHDKNRCGTFDIVEKNIKRLVDNKLNHLLEARMTILPEDFKYMVDGIKCIFEMGIDNIAPIPITDIPWTENDRKTFADQLDILYNWVIQLYEDLENKRNLSVKLIDDNLYLCINENHKMDLVPCTMGSTKWVSIGPSGDIYPCHQSHTRRNQRDSWKIGNILTDIIDESKILGQVKSHQWEKNDNSIYNCSSCNASYICRGGCPSENFEVCGSINKPTDSWCDFVRICKETVSKYHNKILQTNNIRNRKINTLKVNIEIMNEVNKIIELEPNDISYQIKIFNLYELLISNESLIIESFRNYFLQVFNGEKEKIKNRITGDL
mgnify:FL=1